MKPGRGVKLTGQEAVKLDQELEVDIVTLGGLAVSAPLVVLPEIDTYCRQKRIPSQPFGSGMLKFSLDDRLDREFLFQRRRHGCHTSSSMRQVVVALFHSHAQVFQAVEAALSVFQENGYHYLRRPTTSREYSERGVSRHE